MSLVVVVFVVFCFFVFFSRRVCQVSSLVLGGWRRGERERDGGREGERSSATVVADYDMHSPRCFVMWMDSIR